MDFSKKPFRGSGLAPDHIMLSLSGDPSTTMTVTWRTDISVSEGYVLYRKHGTDDGFTRADAVCGEFVSDIDSSMMHWVKLTGLCPGTAYEYTCGDGGNRSEVFAFMTAPEKIGKFKFVCFSDQQQGSPFDAPDYSVFHDFVKSVLEENPDTAFILTGGDNTDCGQHEVQWNGAMEGWKGIAERVPVQMALGNHDNRGFRDYRHAIGRFYAEPAEFFGKQFRGSYPDNGPEGWKTENYSFEYGNAHFTVIGINAPEEVNEWLKRDLDNESTWKFGVYHFPICYSGCDCENDDAYPMMTEGMEMLDILFSGHEHNFSRSFPRRRDELFDRPSQGTIHYMLGNSGCNPAGAKTLHKIWHAAYFPQEEDVCAVCIVEVDGDKVTLTEKLSDGRTVDRCVIDKKTDTIDPPALAPYIRGGRTLLTYKGAPLGLCAADLPCLKRGENWYAPLAALFTWMGADVERGPGRVKLSVYGRSAEFRQGSDTAVTDEGEVRLPAPVIRANRGQLYMPIDAVALFGMRWSYAARNNFISVEHASESHPVPRQP